MIVNTSINMAENESQGFNIYYFFTFPGMNGVMVSTRNTRRVADNSIVFNDKRTFNLTAQSHGFALDAILCEKGEILTPLLTQLVSNTFPFLL